MNLHWIHCFEFDMQKQHEKLCPMYVLCGNYIGSIQKNIHAKDKQRKKVKCHSYKSLLHTYSIDIKITSHDGILGKRCDVNDGKIFQERKDLDGAVFIYGQLN